MVIMKPALNGNGCRKAFTLVELLVVVAIIGVLIGLLLPAVQSAREAARRSACTNNLKQIGLAIHNYTDARRSLPLGSNLPTTFVNNDYGHSFVVFILPFLEEQSLYDGFDLTKKYNASPNKENSLKRTLQALLCPSSEARLSPASELGTAASTTHYVGIMGPNDSTNVYARDTAADGSQYGRVAIQGVLLRDRPVALKDITDGLSKTLLVGELSWNDANAHRVWNRGCCHSASQRVCSGTKNIRHGFRSYRYDYDGGNRAFNDASLGSEHPGGTMVLFCDGSVRQLANTTPTDLLYKLASRNHGEVVEVD
jgi:prepilin-type N-terminal cleavage/methylation domain-containing protein/prepilin-type processing-associated H-X9-DG protein